MKGMIAPTYSQPSVLGCTRMSPWPQTAFWALLLILWTTLSGSAAEAESPSASWHPQTLTAALGITALFAVFGIFLAVVGYKLFDAFTPGQLHKEIIENKNVAAAMIGAAVIIGVCIIIAAAMIG